VIDGEDRSLLEFSQELIRVTIPITEMKDIPLFVTLMHGLSTSDQNTNWRVDPPYIKVSGDPVAIGNINSIQLGTIDMTTFSLTSTESFAIIVPDHLTNISGITIATVHVEVIGLEIAFLITSNLHVSNIPLGHQVEIMTQSLDVRLRGRSEDIAHVTPLNLRVVADLADRNPGTQRVPATVYIDGIDADIDPVGPYFLTVTISVEEDE
jgi:YbbR domain-containing protein